MEKKDLEAAELVAKLTSQVQYFRDFSMEVQNKAIAIANELDEVRFLLIAYMVKNNQLGFTITNDFLPKLERFIGDGIGLVKRKTGDGWVVEFKRSEDNKEVV